MRLQSLVVIVFVVFFLLCLSSIAVVSAASPPPGYSYVKSHSIVGSPDGALTDYQVKFIVHSGISTDNDQDVYLNGCSLRWPNDIQFTDSSYNLLSYWIESFDANNATVWVKVPSIPEGPGSATVYLYYGRSGDLGACNGSSTFVAFDDFSTNRIGSYWAETYQMNGGGDSNYCRGYPDTHTVNGGGYLFSQTSSSDRAAGIGLVNPVPGYVMCNVVLNYSNRYGRSPPWTIFGLDFTGAKYDNTRTVQLGYWGGVLNYNPNSPSDCIDIQFTNHPNATNNMLVYRNNSLVWQGHMGFNNQQKPLLFMRTASSETLTAYWREFYARAYTPNEPTHGAWSNDIPGEYNYVKNHVIIGNTTALSNYQMKFIVHNDSGNDNLQDVYLNGHSLSWPYDIRFRDSNNNPLSYWIESNDTNTATVWVKVGYIPQRPGSTTIYMYYGRANDIGVSDGPGTFTFFDNFNNLDQWRPTGSVSVSNSIAKVNSSSTIPFSSLTSLSQFPDNTRIKFKAKTSDCGKTSGNPANYERFISALDRFYEISDYADNSRTAPSYIWGYPGMNTTCNLAGWNVSVYHTQELVRHGLPTWYVDNANGVSGTSTYYDTRSQYLSFQAGGKSGEIDIDWVYVMNYTNNEPTPGAWGVGVPTVTADFTPKITNGAFPQMVQFIDNSIGNPTGRLWDFGDNTVSTEQNPRHVYNSPGNYTISLRVWNQFSTSICYGYVNVTTSTASFTATPDNGIVPLDVQFQPFTMNADSYYWDFGDNDKTDLKCPLHTYTQPGNYTVSLTVTLGGQRITETCPNLIYVSPYIWTHECYGSQYTGLGVVDLFQSTSIVSYGAVFDSHLGTQGQWIYDFNDSSLGYAMRDDNKARVTDIGYQKLTLGTLYGGNNFEFVTSSEWVAANPQYNGLPQPITEGAKTTIDYAIAGLLFLSNEFGGIGFAYDTLTFMSGMKNAIDQYYSPDNGPTWVYQWKYGNLLNVPPGEHDVGHTCQWQVDIDVNQDIGFDVKEELMAYNLMDEGDNTCWGVVTGYQMGITSFPDPSQLTKAQLQQYGITMVTVDQIPDMAKKMHLDQATTQRLIKGGKPVYYASNVSIRVVKSSKVIKNIRMNDTVNPIEEQAGLKINDSVNDTSNFSLGQSNPILNTSVNDTINLPVMQINSIENNLENISDRDE